MVPSIGPPKVWVSLSELGGPEIQLCMNRGQTRSPSETRFTPLPVAFTIPTPSETGISGRVPVLEPYPLRTTNRSR